MLPPFVSVSLSPLPLSRSFLWSELFPETAGHTEMTLISLSASFILHPSLTHSFLFCLAFPPHPFPFCSPLSSICAAASSTFISLPHVSLSLFLHSPPLNPYSPAPDIPRCCVCVCLHTCICFSVCKVVHVCMLYFCLCVFVAAPVDCMSEDDKVLSGRWSGTVPTVDWLLCFY